MAAKVIVVDYDRGNLFSVGRALEHCGGYVEITGSPEKILDAERLVLPGVGAFGDAMEELQKRGLVEKIKEFAAGRTWEGSIFEGLPSRPYCYFVHSFAAEPVDEAHRLADCRYNGRRLAAAVRHDNLWGCQFRPEKSGETGLRILRNFLARD
jgi:glutamine amidotransferase